MTLHFVEDDDGARKALGILAETLQFPVKSCDSAEEMLDADPAAPADASSTT